MDIIFDIDGTLLDISHRTHFLDKSPPDWHGFRNPKLKQWDEPIVPVIATLNALKVDHRIILASGRIIHEKDDTLFSLRPHIPDIDDFPFYMRSEKDYRHDTETKADLLNKMFEDGLNPVMAFDDRPAVIRVWREKGLLVADVGKGKEF